MPLQTTPNPNEAFYFSYDVFISYKSEQDSWANRIARSLEDMGLRVWRDKDGGIRIGEEWQDEIEAGIRDSQRMLVIWSDLIHKNSKSVVHDEIRKMKSFHENDARRKFFTIRLDDAPLHDILSPYHATHSFQKLHQLYGDKGADKVDVVEWYKALLELLYGIGIQNIVEVRFAAIAMTRTQAEQLFKNPEQYAQNVESFHLIKKAMELTCGFKLDRYGETPDAWQPFKETDYEGEFSVLDILRSYDDGKKEWLRESTEAHEQTKWFFVSKSEDLLSDDRDLRRAAYESLLDGPCLILLDPVSLIHKDIYDRILKSGIHTHKYSFIISVSPFIAHMHNELRSTADGIEAALEDVLEQAYVRFKKSFHPLQYASVMNIEYEFQFRRWLQVAADSIIDAKETLLKPSLHPQRRNEIQRRRRSAPNRSVITMAQTN